MSSLNPPFHHYSALPLVLLLLLCGLAPPRPVAAQQERSKELRGYAYPKPRSRFYLANVTAAYYWTSKPVPAALFGAPRNIRASAADLRPFVHPRVMAGPAEWLKTLRRYADPRVHDVAGTWSANYLRLTRGNGPDSVVIARLAELESSGQTSAFTGARRESFGSDAAYDKYRNGLSGLAREVEKSNEMSSHNLFLCAFWASVAEQQEQQGDKPFLPVRNTTQKCVNATLAWAKALLAHRTLHCNPDCTVSDDWNGRRSYLWNTALGWAVSNDWYTHGASLALAYDVLYGKLSDGERTVVRSALALLVSRRWAWGTTQTSDRRSPNVEKDPHRVFSNWGPYHSNLYLTNLAIEGETGFVPYAEEVLRAHQAPESGKAETGAASREPVFNGTFVRRFEAVLSAFFTHTIYPDGGTFEDGYTYHTALREGALGLIAYQRRGGRVIDTARFRNMVMNVLQMWEPWPCGHLVGHASGGGLGYPTYVGLIRYAYPDGALPKLAWAKRVGRTIDNAKCRILWSQTQHQMALFGGEHDVPAEDVVDLPHKLPPSLRKLYPLAYVSPRRGLVVFHGNDRPDAAYLQLDARPDSFFPGHDNADRGGVTFVALRKRWLVDHAWDDNVDSRKHSLFHIDGLSQAMKAPSVTILRATDDDVGALASADLTYTSNVWWAPAWQGPKGGSGDIMEYSADGKSARKHSYLMMDAETHSPWELGWPMEDDAKDIGFFRTMKLQGYEHLNFAGLNEWRRPLRTQYLSYYVRSVGMVRGAPKSGVAPAPGFAFIVDAAGFPTGRHVFESYLQLDDAVEVESGGSSCTRNTCKIVLKSGMAPEGSLDGVEDEDAVDKHEDARVVLYVNSIHNGIDFRVETFKGEAPHRRLVIRAARATAHEQLWVALLPHFDGDDHGFKMARHSDGAVQFTFDGAQHTFRVDRATHVLERDGAPPHVPRPVPDLTVREGLQTAPPAPETDATPTLMNATDTTMIDDELEMSAMPDASGEPGEVELADPFLDAVEPSTTPIVPTPSPETGVANETDTAESVEPETDDEDAEVEADDDIEVFDDDSSGTDAERGIQSEEGDRTWKRHEWQGLDEPGALQPIPLVASRWTTVRGASLVRSDTSFYDDNAATRGAFQTAFTVVAGVREADRNDTDSRSVPGRRRRAEEPDVETVVDEVRTCNGGTTVRVHSMQWYDCGDNNGFELVRWAMRECRFLGGAAADEDEEFVCNSDTPPGRRRLRMRKRLRKGRTYFVLVTMSEVSDEVDPDQEQEPQLRIAHVAQEA